MICFRKLLVLNLGSFAFPNETRKGVTGEFFGETAFGQPSCPGEKCPCQGYQDPTYRFQRWGVGWLTREPCVANPRALWGVTSVAQNSPEALQNISANEAGSVFCTPRSRGTGPGPNLRPSCVRYPPRGRVRDGYGRRVRFGLLPQSARKSLRF